MMHGETQWQQDHWKAMDARRCEQNLNGRVKIGKHTSRNHPPLHRLHNIGGNTNIKTLNGVNTKTLFKDSCAFAELFSRSFAYKQ